MATTTTTRPRQQQTRGVVIGINELAALRKRFADLSDALSHDTELAEAVGHQQAQSAKRRIEETKRGPNGKPWKSWSRTYAKTREPHHSLLVGEGKLHDSIQYDVKSALEVHVGSNMQYARAHLYGNPKRNLPARPYLDTQPGFADPHDRAELRDVLRDFFRKHGLVKR